MTFAPTHVDHTPAVCWACGRHAIGIGIGDAAKEPKFLCRECVNIMHELKHLRRMDAMEIEAIDGGVDAVGDLIEALGGKTELADFDDEERRALVKAAWLGCADRLREVVRNKGVPF